MNMDDSETHKVITYKCLLDIIRKTILKQASTLRKFREHFMLAYTPI